MRDVTVGEVLPELHVVAPDRQRRWTVLPRAALTIPHLIVLFGLSIAAFVVLVIGWFGALALGRLPDWCARFLAGYLAWTIRTAAYLYLVTDTYPPFTWAPVGIELPPTTRLNRAAVLFRIVLGFPAAVVLTVVSFGWAVLAFFFWLITLVAGRTPGPVRDAGIALLRYDLRAYAYFYLLSPAYPKHLLRSAGAGRTLLIVLVVLGAIGYPGAITAEVLTADTTQPASISPRSSVVVVSLNAQATPANAPEINAAIVSTLQALPHVRSVVYNSPEQSFEKAKQVFADDPKLEQLLTPQAFSPLYLVTVDDPSAVAHVESVAKSLTGVAQVESR